MIPSRSHILLVLGAPNAPDGQLSPMAISRLDACYGLYARGDYYILLTGGYGAFNTSSRPHHWHARRYLTGKGVPAARILPGVDSANTVEDATLSRPLITGAASVTVITSDYHLQRAGMIFCDVYKATAPLRFIGAPSYALDYPQLLALWQHEQRAIRHLQENGVHF